MEEEQQHEEPPQQESGGWGWGWGGWGSSVMSAAAAIGETANSFVAAIADEEEEEESTEKPEEETTRESDESKGEGEGSDNTEATKEEEEETEVDTAEMIEKSIWGAVTFLGSAIQSSAIYDGFAKSAQALIEGVQEPSSFEKSVDLSFATLEAVGKRTADLFAIEVDESQTVEQQPDAQQQQEGAVASSPQVARANAKQTPTTEGSANSEEPSTFDANFDECLGNVHLQALIDISTRSLVSVDEMDQSFKSQYTLQLEKIHSLFEEEEEEEEEEEVGEEADKTGEDEDDEDPQEAKRTRLNKQIDEVQQKVNLNRKARTKRKSLEAFVTAALSLGSGKVTEFEVALKAKLGSGGSQSEEEKKEISGGPSAAELQELVQGHMDRCFAKSMMILSEMSASSVELFLRIGESYLAENQKGLEGKEGEKEGGQDLLPVHHHIQLITLLKKLLGAEVAQISAAFVASLNKIAEQGKEALEKTKTEGKGEGEGSTEEQEEGEGLDGKLSGYVTDIYTNHVARCHSNLHEAAKQFEGMCQFLTLKYAK